MPRNNRRPNRRRGGNGRGARPAGRGLIPHPPPFPSSPVYTRLVRFIATGAVNTTVSATSVLDLMCMATAANAAYRRIFAFKLSRVELWAPPGTTVPASCSLTWLGSFANLQVHADQSIGASEPAHVRVRPPAATLLADWHSGSNTDNLFVITGPAGLIIDLLFQFTLMDGLATSTAVTGAVAGATIGQSYVRALDSTGGTNNMVPQGVVTI